MISRRFFIGGLLAAGVAPIAIARSASLMPIKPLVVLPQLFSLPPEFIYGGYYPHQIDALRQFQKKAMFGVHYGVKTGRYNPSVFGKTLEIRSLSEQCRQLQQDLRTAR